MPFHAHVRSARPVALFHEHGNKFRLVELRIDDDALPFLHTSAHARDQLCIVTKKRLFHICKLPVFVFFIILFFRGKVNFRPRYTAGGKYFLAYLCHFFSTC